MSEQQQQLQFRYALSLDRRMVRDGARELRSPRQQLVEKIQNGNCFNRRRKIQRVCERAQLESDKPEIRIFPIPEKNIIP